MFDYNIRNDENADVKAEEKDKGRKEDSVKKENVKEVVQRITL